MASRQAISNSTFSSDRTNCNDVNISFYKKKDVNTKIWYLSLQKKKSGSGGSRHKTSMVADTVEVCVVNRQLEADNNLCVDVRGLDAVGVGSSVIEQGL